MKNKYTVFLLYLSAFIIIVICVIQIYDLVKYNVADVSNINMDVYNHFRTSKSITLFLSTAAVAILIAREGINVEIKRKAYTDITGIKNKHACFEQMSMLECNDNTLNIGLAMFDLNNLKTVNDFYGHEKGDELIQNFVILLKQAAGNKYFIGRFGGDEFIVIIQNCTEEMMENYIANVHMMVEKFNKGRTIQLSYACGYEISTREHYYLIEELLKEADKKMYENKKKIKSKSLMETNRISKIIDTDRISPVMKDDLTGIFNHDAFVTTVSKIISIIDKKTELALIWSDINDFRYLNKSFGYNEGNNILKKFAKSLSNQTFCLCSSRVYADNFVFLADVSNMTDKEAEQLIKNWNTQFSALINEAYKESRIIIKSGIYFVKNRCELVETMIDNSYCARKCGKNPLNNVYVYTDEISKINRKRSEIINSFKNAIEQEEFVIYVQPQVFCLGKKVESAEVLIRWRREDKELWLPNDFIPIFEQTGDIVEMDFYVYEKVFSYLYNRLIEGKPLISMSVNVSRVHLSKVNQFIRRMESLHKKYPIPTALITFELTESAYIQEINPALIFIEELHKQGYKVSMDDFGSGYSSLKVLQDMPFDEIKFDRVFLSEDINEKGSRILLQMIKLVKSLGKTIVCEGVETEEHVALVKKSECDIMQGFYYYKPFALEELVI